MIRIDVRDNLARIELRYQRLNDDLREKVIVRALNKTATTVRAEASKEIRKDYNLKAKVIKDQITINRANRTTLTAVIVASGKPIPLIEFEARPTATHTGGRRGSNVTVKVKRRRLVVRDAFIATMPGGHVGIFKRTGKFGRRKNPRLERIKQRFSISLPTAFTNKAVTEALVRAAQKRFPVVMEQETRYARSKL